MMENTKGPEKGSGKFYGQGYEKKYDQGKPFKKFSRDRRQGRFQKKSWDKAGRGGAARSSERRSQKALLDPTQLPRGPQARFQALEVLIEADESGRFVDQLLDEKILGDLISPPNRQLIQEITYGAVRHRNTIDHVLDNYIHFAMRRQHVAVRWALRLGVYQLVYLSRIPSHAAIHGSVEALKAVPGINAHDVGFANAVLRRLHNDILKKGEEPPADKDDLNALPARHGWCFFNRPVLPPLSTAKIQHLTVKYSHPKWLLARWIERFGEEDAVLLCIANNKAPMVSAILTGQAPSREEAVKALEAAGVTVEPGALPESLRLRRLGDARLLEPFQNGWIRIQDETAKLIGEALAPPPGARVLDLCASPGGKSSQLLERIGPQGHLVACDVGEEKLTRLRENLERIGANFTLVNVPPEPEKLPLEEKFSHILVDVPCSNTGVLSRRPEARWRVHLEDIAKLAELQGRLLDAAVKRLAPGGRLVYSTCSIEPEENGQVVAQARRRHPALEEEASRLFLPHRDGADGGYYAILKN
ncbi:MAG: hypothetical protein HY717_12730 [Planctomycetes bacterium]|nr:hypothetical protein [Planctomycetota bacterium]